MSPTIPPNRITVFPLKDDLQWYDPDVIFKPFDDIFGRGVIGSTDLQVVANGTPDGQISVQAGRGYVPYSGGGKRYFQTSVPIRSDAAEFINAIPTWPGSGNPKVHRVIARIRDATITPADQLKGGVFDVLAGTATSGATLANLAGAQSVPADSLLLGNVLQNGSTISTGGIDSTFGTVRARARIGAGASPTKGFQVGGASLTDRGWLNFLAGAGMTISAADNPGNDSADVTFAAVVPDLKLLMDYTVTASGGDASIDTNTILGGALPTTYGALRVIGYVAGAASGNDGILRCRFNNDSGSNYDNALYRNDINGSAWLDNSTAATVGTVMEIPFASSTRFGVFDMVIPNYAFASFPRIAMISAIEPVLFSTNTNGLTLINGGFLWRIQAGVTDVALTRLSFSAATGNLRQNSRIRIYGT